MSGSCKKCGTPCTTRVSQYPNPTVIRKHWARNIQGVQNKLPNLLQPIPRLVIAVRDLPKLIAKGKQEHFCQRIEIRVMVKLS